MLERTLWWWWGEWNLGRDHLEARRSLRRQWNDLANVGHVFGWGLGSFAQHTSSSSSVQIPAVPAKDYLSAWILKTTVLAYSQSGPDHPPPITASAWEPPKATSRGLGSRNRNNAVVNSKHKLGAGDTRSKSQPSKWKNKSSRVPTGPSRPL